MGRVNGEEVSTATNATYSFDDPGIYQVELMVTSSDGATSTWVDDVEILENSLDSNYIIRNSTSLASFRSAPSYEWYQNDVVIAGATSRTIPYSGEKSIYFVVTSDGVCNRKSAVIDFTTSVVNVDIEKEEGILFYPIPVDNYLNYEINRSSGVEKNIQITDLLGRTLYDSQYDRLNSGSIDVSNFSSGIYILILTIDEEQFSKKFVKK